jgi:hypothetical protein
MMNMARTTADQPGISARLARRVRSAGDRLFHASDARALARGWQITAGRSGLSRAYRDPRFDLLESCPGCGWSGKNARRPCAGCAGSGRITLGGHRADLEVSRWE